jgi:hypothetical protein
VEDDWRPYQSKQDALRAWRRLGGIRLQVMEELGLLKDPNHRSVDKGSITRRDKRTQGMP